MDIFTKLEEYIKEDDLYVGPKNNQVVYHEEDVDEEEYQFMKKRYEEAKKQIKKTEELIKNRFIDKDSKKIKQSLEGDKKFVKNWETKIEPWMLEILKKAKQ
jgi:hypothetical protein